MTLTVQFLTIISMIAGGIYLGIAIETFRRFEGAWKKRKVFSYIIEICFWLLQSLILFYLLFRVNQGELRFYILLALLCGYSAYNALLKSYYQRLLERMIVSCLSIYRFLYRMVHLFFIRPIIRIFQLILSILFALWGGLVWVAVLLYKIVFYPIRLIGMFIWRLVPKNAKNKISHLAGFYSKIKNKIVNWKHSDKKDE
ncbi:spore cortex biosynthesis protein YabQ (plasmid) [Radiobacillus kanasensis]|uniref:spore cortex biosynthesis protein YabQ n=1 Tax=Radiobacillus kanasensis TaxID=2844358 RepID=UPI001E446E8C|nr:spore cortex biosynthesis protein YabQ [Radiobacillus kanasensis]UFU01479.1 spore cortex biosynthesis protein YabQ [Radiobacillus kanasensis]